MSFEKDVMMFVPRKSIMRLFFLGTVEILWSKNSQVYHLNFFTSTFSRQPVKFSHTSSSSSLAANDHDGVLCVGG